MVEKKLVKSLAAQKGKKLERVKQGGKPENTSRCRTLPLKVREEDIPELLRKKFFLFTPKIKKAELFYLSCWRVELRFYVSYLNARREDKGTLEFIVDPIKGCGVNEERIRLKFAYDNIPDNLISDKTMTKEVAEKKAIIDARWKVLLSRYKRPAELETVSTMSFLRPYYKVYTVWGSKEEIQWIPADNFASYFIYN